MGIPGTVGEAKVDGCRYQFVSRCYNVGGIVLTFSYSLLLNTANFMKLCSIDADVSHLPLEPLINKEGVSYFQSPRFSVLLLFGLTEIMASIAWNEDVSDQELLQVNDIDQTLIATGLSHL